ncbi:MAG: glutathione binding-like protein [Burkholderiales bacterium]
MAGEGAALRADYKAKYPFAMVPMLELDDGTQIGEAMAICRYFETLHPSPPLMGTDAKDKAIVEMWERRAYDEGMIGTAEIVRNTHPAFADRGIGGYATSVPQLPSLVERGHKRVRRFFEMFDGQLASNEFVAGVRVSVADITALCSMDFAKVLGKISIPEGHRNLIRWYNMMSARPSAKA